MSNVYPSRVSEASLPPTTVVALEQGDVVPSGRQPVATASPPTPPPTTTTRATSERDRDAVDDVCVDRVGIVSAGGP